MSKLAIAYLGQGRGPFSMLLAEMVAHTKDAGVETFIVNVRGSDPIGGRTKAARIALENRASRILWLDDDMVFPVDTALRLMEHEVPVVAANYVMRKLNDDGSLTPVASHYTEGGLVCERLQSAGQSGLVPCHNIGMGCMLTHRRVFEQIEFPWFGGKWFRKFQSPHGDAKPVIGVPHWDDWTFTYEDTWFCERLRNAGIPIKVDQDLSNVVGHPGEATFYLEGIATLS